MRLLCSLMLIVIYFLACHQETVNNPVDHNQKISEEEIQIAKDLIQGAFDHVWGGIDTSSVKNYHTEDFIILEQGEIWNNDRIKEYMLSQLANEDRALRINTMDYISIDKYGSCIQVAYHNNAKFSKNDSIVGEANWLESATAIPTPNGWKLKMMHSTYVPQ